MAVTPVSSASGTQGTTGISRVNTQNGKIVIDYKGQKYPLTKKQADQYNEILYNINYVRNRIDELETELGTKGLSNERKSEIQAELAPLKEKYAKQQATASFDILPSASGDMFVSFSLKKDINAEEFKQLFNLSNGALRTSLKNEALEDGIGVEKAYERDINKPYMSYDDVMMTEGLPVEFYNGVRLVESDDAGHYYPDYTKATLSSGGTYNVAGSYVDSPDSKPWWKFW